METLFSGTVIQIYKNLPLNTPEKYSNVSLPDAAGHVRSVLQSLPKQADEVEIAYLRGLFDNELKLDTTSVFHNKAEASLIVKANFDYVIQLPPSVSVQKKTERSPVQPKVESTKEDQFSDLFKSTLQSNLEKAVHDN